MILSAQFGWYFLLTNLRQARQNQSILVSASSEEQTTKKVFHVHGTPEGSIFIMEGNSVCSPQ